MAKKAAVKLTCGDEDSVLAALHEWINRVTAPGTPSAKKKHIAGLYAPDAVLFGTVSPWLRDSPAEVEEYFEHFLGGKTEIQVIIADSPRVRIIPSGSSRVAVSTGYYIFFYKKDGVLHSVPARFTFCYRCSGDDEWEIIDHHSSAMPQ